MIEFTYTVLFILNQCQFVVAQEMGLAAKPALWDIVPDPVSEGSSHRTLFTDPQSPP